MITELISSPLTRRNSLNDVAERMRRGRTVMKTSFPSNCVSSMLNCLYNSSEVFLEVLSKPSSGNSIFMELDSRRI